MNDDIEWVGPLKETIEQILADFAAGGDSAGSVMRRFLEHRGDEERFDALFERMPPAVQRQAIKTAILNRDNFDAIIGDLEEPILKRRYASFRDWALARPDVMGAVTSGSR
jgi:hypothetical protein